MKSILCLLHWLFHLLAHSLTKFLPAHKATPRTSQFVLDNLPALILIFHFQSSLQALFQIFYFRVTDSILTLNSWLSPPCTLKSLQISIWAFSSLSLHTLLCLHSLPLLLVKISHLALAPIEIPSKKKKKNPSGVGKILVFGHVRVKHFNQEKMT